MNTIKNRCAIAVLAVLLCGSVQAATLVAYDINSASFTSSTTSFTASTTDIGLTASATTFGSFGGAVQGSRSYFRSAANGAGGTANLAFRVLDSTDLTTRVLKDNESQAVTANSFVQFTVTPTVGQVLNLTSFTAYVASDSQGSAAFGTSFFVRSSLDGFTANLGTATLSTSTNVLTSGTLTADLSGSSFQSIGSSVTFRIYAYANLSSAAASTMIARMDNLTLAGSVSATPVPEPSSYALMAGLAGLFVAGTRGGRQRRVLKSS